MKTVICILVLGLIGVYGAPSNLTTTERSSTRATTIGSVTATSARVNATSVRPTAAPRVAVTSGPNMTNRTTTPAARQPEQQTDDFESGGNAVVFAGICGPDGCVVRGDVYENVFPVSSL